jgi:hypothetical protein
VLNRYFGHAEPDVATFQALREPAAGRLVLVVGKYAEVGGLNHNVEVVVVDEPRDLFGDQWRAAVGGVHALAPDSDRGFQGEPPSVIVTI